MNSDESVQERPQQAAKNRYGTSKQEILKAAERLFAEQGFASTTLRDVAAKSGANTALVGYYFGGKEGLRQAVAELQIEKFNEIFDRILVKGETVTEADFARMIREFLTFLRNDQLIHRLRLWSLADGGEFAQQMAQSLWNPFISQFETVIKRLNHKIPPDQVRVLSIYMGALLQKYADFRWIYSKILALEAEPEQFLKAYEDLVFSDIMRHATTGLTNAQALS